MREHYFPSWGLADKGTSMFVTIICHMVLLLKKIEGHHTGNAKAVQPEEMKP